MPLKSKSLIFSSVVVSQSLRESSCIFGLIVITVVVVAQFRPPSCKWPLLHHLVLLCPAPSTAPPSVRPLSAHKWVSHSNPFIHTGIANLTPIKSLRCSFGEIHFSVSSQSARDRAGQWQWDCNNNICQLGPCGWHRGS